MGGKGGQRLQFQDLEFNAENLVIIYTVLDQIILKGNVPSKKNSKQIIRNRKTGKPLMISSGNYLSWEETKLWELKKYKKIDAKKITITFYPPTNAISDLTNKTESVMDLLVTGGLLKDDNWFIIPELSLKFGGKDKENPRVVIEY